MNALTEKTNLTLGTASLVDINKVVPSVTNPRKHFDKDAHKEMIDSVKRLGVIQPIIVRPMAKGGSFEIVAGERRWRAAKEAGLQQIPALVRELTDIEALEIQVVENLQRSDLHPLEEADGYAQLMKLHNVTADEIIGKVGKSKTYVYGRLKLCSLCPAARNAFYDGKLTPSTALLIARIPGTDLQTRAIKEITEGKYHGDGPMSYRAAVEHIQNNYMLRLTQAPFDTKDAMLIPAAGACGACPKRTGNQKELFGDVKSADVCTDPECFDDKRQAHYSVARKAQEAKGKRVIYGPAAKKAMPHWENGGDYLAGGYVKINEMVYVGGRHQRPRDLLGDDYESMLIQHPGTGKMIEVATQQAVEKAVQQKSKTGKSKAATKSTAKAKPKGPDVDEMLLERLVQLIQKKAPKEFGKAHLQVLAKRVLEMSGTRTDDLQVSATARGWPGNAFSSGHYSKKMPAQVAKFDVRELTLLMFDFAFHSNRYDRKPILAVFGIDEQAVREQIIEERKAAAKAAREAGKK